MTNLRFGGACALFGVAVSALMLSEPGRSDAAVDESRQLVFGNATGMLRTISTTGTIDLSNPFFQSLGTNGRACVSCHSPSEGWSITPQRVEGRFRESAGTDAIFRPNDGSNCPGAVHDSLEEQRANYSLLLTRGLIRIGLVVPDDAEFQIIAATDPYQCGWSTRELSVYRRPLPSTNVKFLSAVMWDGRESSIESAIDDDLSNQANSATVGHAQAVNNVSDQDRRKIVAFQLGLFTAQAYDNAAGQLNADGAEGGPDALSQQRFFIGINDPVGLNPEGVAFNPEAFTLFSPWGSSSGIAARLRCRGEERNRTRTGNIQHPSVFNQRGEWSEQGDVRHAESGRPDRRHLYRVP